MNHETNWLPGLLMLAAGVVAALVFLFTSKRAAPVTKPADRANPEPAPATAVSDDLEAKYQRLLGELKEHIANKHLVPADVWEREHARLEQAAAAALRERDGAKHEALKAQARLEKKAQDAAKDTGFFAQHPAVGGALVGGLVVAFFAYLGMSVSNPENARVDGPPGMGGAVGSPQPGGPRQPQADPKLEALASRVQADPDDIEAVTGLAMHLISLQSFNEAKPLLARAALLDPYHVRGRVGRAVLRAVDGDVAGAQSELERLGANYPEAYDAHLYAGLLALEQNDERRAVRDLELYVNTAPPSEQPPMIRAEVEKMKAELAGAPQGP
ncbi:MAG: hypothetical protein AB1730_19395 [Myxococcota bacterium]|jgi:hypothetical protein